MSLTLEQFFPHARPWVESLANSFPGQYVKPQFAWWEVGHILSLVTLGGTTILMNLRLLGVGLTQEQPSEIYRDLRFWQNLGVIGIVVTGLLIGSANAERLYDSAAFIVKMCALLAGVILTYGASRPVAAADGQVSVAARAWFALGLIIWGLGLWVFVTSDLISPGLYHLLSAAGLLVLAVAKGRMRWGFLAAMAALIAAQFVATHFIVKPDDYSRLDPVNIGFAWTYAVAIVGTASMLLFRAGGRGGSGPMAAIIAYSTILVWVTGAAAGRWIAFA